MNKQEDLYYMQDSRSYVGNDILWWALNGSGYTADMSRAQAYTREDALSMHKDRITDIPWPKKYIDDNTRPVVDMQRVRIKDALKGTGVKLIKPKRKRPTTGKTRGNCPDCGKITWDYNPYENAYCKECEINR